jgi:hypothetical protein
MSTKKATVVALCLSVIATCLQRNDALGSDATVHLSGPEVAAISVAASDFRKKGYSKTELQHYTVELTRRDKMFEVVFVPDDRPSSDPNYAGTGGDTAYGPEVHYFVSTETLKILRIEFAR